MPNQVSTGAAVACTFGTAPASFTASSVEVAATAPAGVITDVSVSIAAGAKHACPQHPAIERLRSIAYGPVSWLWE